MLCYPLAQPIGLLLQGSPVFKRRVRNVRRLQLVCLNLFYERIQLDMHRYDSEPTSKPVQPQAPYLSRSWPISRAPGDLKAIG